METPTSPSQCPSLIMQLPFELLIMVAKFVDRNDPRCCPQHGLVRIKRGDLPSLSRVNKWFRQACIATGLFASLEPRLMPTLHGATAFLSSIHRGYHHMRVMKMDSLCVNLATPKAWPLCVHLLELYPDVPELCLRGESSNLREWQDDPELEALRNGLRAFKGHSLVLRDMLITKNVMTTLTRLRVGNITSIDFQLNARIILRHNEARMSFPNLRRATISCSKMNWKSTVCHFSRHFLGSSKRVTGLHLLYCWQGKDRWVGDLSNNYYRSKCLDLKYFLSKSTGMKFPPVVAQNSMITRTRKCRLLASKDDGLIGLKSPSGVRPFKDCSKFSTEQSAMAIRFLFD